MANSRDGHKLSYWSASILFCFLSAGKSRFQILQQLCLFVRMDDVHGLQRRGESWRSQMYCHWLKNIQLVRSQPAKENAFQWLFGKLFVSILFEFDLKDICLLYRNTRYHPKFILWIWYIRVCSLFYATATRKKCFMFNEFMFNVVVIFLAGTHWHALQGFTISKYNYFP